MLLRRRELVFSHNYSKGNQRISSELMIQLIHHMLISNQHINTLLNIKQ